VGERQPWDELSQHRWGQVDLAVHLALGLLASVLVSVLIINELRGKGE